MLSEIESDAFKDSGHERGAIRFRRGLNTVLGSASGANSIGKSTFLLAIDYAFGGTSYGKRNDIRDHVGVHEVRFTHTIADVSHRFSRSTGDNDSVWCCAEGYVPSKKITLKEFNNWLLTSYGLDGIYASFRDLVGCHIRVYGKGSLDEIHPLEANSKESQKSGVDRTLKLFGEYDALNDCEERLKEASEQKRTFSAACAKGYIAAAGKRSEVRLNEKRIAELESDSRELMDSFESGLAEADDVKSAAVVEIKSKMSGLMRKKTRLKAQLRRVEAESELGSASAVTGRFEELSRFFPGCDLRSVEEVEGFHRGLATILKREQAEAKADIETQLALIAEEIERLKAQANEMGEISSLPTAVVKSYANYQSEIRRLRDANDAYAKKVELGTEAKLRKKEADEARDGALRSIEEVVNGDLAELSAEIVGEGRSAPRLTFGSGKGYLYSIWGDEGTGSGVRAMVMLDLVFLNRTRLPLAVCDSVALKQVADEPLIRLLEHCDQSDKQVFIAFDRAESYGNGGLPEVIDRSVVLSLSDGHELFGKSWSKKSETAKAEDV